MLWDMGQEIRWGYFLSKDPHKYVVTRVVGGNRKSTQEH